MLNPNFLDVRIGNEVIALPDAPGAAPFLFAQQGLGAHSGFTFNQYREDQLIPVLVA